MKILHISHSDFIGGAARAAYRLHRAQRSLGIDSKMLVRVKKTDDQTVLSAEKSYHKLTNLMRFHLGHQFGKLQVSSNTNFHSGNWLPSRLAKKINSSDADIINLHWVAGETMSIEDIGRINKPILWTLHDMWPFCGSEHVTGNENLPRWQEGYTKHNRAKLDKGIDLDRLVWKRKKRVWKKHFHLVAPSNWMADCVRKSSLLGESEIKTIPNVLDTSIFKPLDQDYCRSILNLPQNVKIILFGAIGGSTDSNKGFDLLIDSLNKFALSTKRHKEQILCVIFGQNQPLSPPALPFLSKWIGHIYDDYTLSVLYNAADVMIVPSKIENLPQTATEAQACGTPVIAFNTSGLADAVEHDKTGYLAHPFDTFDLAVGIEELLSNDELRMYFAKNARDRAEKLWSKEIVINQYTNFYQKILTLNLSSN